MCTRIFTLLFLLANLCRGETALSQSKEDTRMASQLRADIIYLASDALEGRRTGSEGEQKAAEYIVKRYTEEKIRPYKNNYYYPFNFVYGREISNATEILINGTAMPVGLDAFPLPFSPNKHVHGDITPDVIEAANITMLPLYSDSVQVNNPHFEAEKYMFERAKQAAKDGATGVLFYDSYGGKWEPSFNKHSEYEQLDIPVIFVTKKIYEKYVKQNDSTAAASGTLSIDLNIVINKTERTGNNVAAYIDNGAAYTVVIGAHYDHLGYGEDGNSLFANAVKEHQIHHGADDNASGTAALLQVAGWINNNKRLHHYNYLFVNFSGEELGLYGSKAFIKDQGIDSAHIAYMINMDMVGRLNDSTHALELGGIGTSPAWATVQEMGGKDFKITVDSSGVGPSDHTSFYNAGIPVLFFFTGSHKDYHKPSDKADLINYPGEVLVINYVDRVIAKMDKEDIKPAFTATRQSSLGRVSFKVTLGIMPDYTYETGGVRVDGVSDNRPAIKAGIKQGDIITKLGDNKVNGMQSYMEALGKFTPGDKTQVTVVRDGKEIVLPIELTAK
jgi:peptidase M28-like protein/PDZ domain-containing protein